KNEELHILLREPALMELARRREPGVLSYCETLVSCGEQECWFTGIRALAAINTYDAIKRLLVISGSLNLGDRRIVLQTVARVVSSAQREDFRRVARIMAVPGILDVTGWTHAALRILKAVCDERGIIVIPSSPDIPLLAKDKGEETELLTPPNAQNSRVKK
ncbi:MAG: hypothetical protein ACFE7R_05940, partial [Candidatus Hodarchaeota archaeon]